MPEARIERIVGRRVWDSRGRPTVEAEIFLYDGANGRAIAPAGASTGTHEAVDLRDGGPVLGGLGVDRAIANINGEIPAALHSMPIADQNAIDRTLIELDGTPNKARLGGNATIAVSMAALHAAAATCGEPLWRNLAAGAEVTLPMPMIQIFGGGAHAGRRVDIQDFLIVPIAAASFDEALVMAGRVYRAGGEVMADRGRLRGVADEGGWWPEFASNAEALDTLVEAIDRATLRPGEEVGIAIDVAASQFYSSGPLSPRRGWGRARNRSAGRTAGWLVPALPDRVGRGSSGRRRRPGHGFVHRQARRPRSDHRRRLSGDFGSACRRGGLSRCLQCGPVEAEPGRHRHRN